MIEISHKQAQLLLRRAADTSLPEEQWAMLEAHLESCAECRAYRDGLAALERGLHRSLGARWRGVHGPGAGVQTRVLAVRNTRDERRRATTIGVLGLLGLVVMLVGGVLYRPQLQHLFAPAPPVTPTPPLPTPSPTPSERFQGLVAYTSQAAGQRQINLLNQTRAQPGAPDVTDLTAGMEPADFPAWSPDGAWLAFISSRSGAPQVYVINVAGTRLTQLTDDASIQWEGPLSWSYDGSWIALLGRRRTQENTPWIYLVPVDRVSDGSTGPRALAQTSGTLGWPRFSPEQPLLAVQRADGGIQVYHTALGWSGEVTRTDRLTLRLHTGDNGAFDWAINGFSLVYLTEGSFMHFDTGQFTRGPQDWPNMMTRSQVVSSGILGPYAKPDALDSQREVIESSVEKGAFRSISYMPGGPLIATLNVNTDTGCATVHLVHAFQYARVKPVDLPGLCVSGDLTRQSWSPDGRWLVVKAQPANPQTGKPEGGSAGLGLYALSTMQSLVTFQRLADLPGGEAAQVVVRPSAAPLGLNPQPAHPPEASAALTVPEKLPGTLIYSVPDASSSASSAASPGSAIIRANPDGAHPQTVLRADAANTCPVLSPDQSKIAFLSDRDDPNRGLAPSQRTGDTARVLNQVYTMNADGSKLAQLTFPLVPYSYPNWIVQMPVYDCPVWSPDSSMLAAVARSGISPRLDLFNLSGSLLRSITIDPASRLAPPVWSPNGASVYLAEPASVGGPPRVGIITWRTPAGANTLFSLPGWDDIQALSLSPDGKQVAVIAVGKAQEGRMTAAALEIFDIPSQKLLTDLRLPGYDPTMQTTPGKIVWGSDGTLTMAFPFGPISRYKAFLMRYNPADKSLHPLAQIEDPLYSWALNDHWFVIGTESGLYGSPDTDVPTGSTMPVRLSSDPASWIDWRN